MTSIFTWLLLLGVLLTCSCKPTSEPVELRPTPSELLGVWTLQNSPTMSSEVHVAIPHIGNSFFLFESNQLVKLTNVLVEETFLPPGGATVYEYRTMLKTEDATWDVTQSQGSWSVEIHLQNKQSIMLHIRKKHNGDLELCYQPDPEREDFLYSRDVKVKGK